MTVYKIDHSAVDGNPEVRFKSLKILVGARGFEPPTPPGPEIRNFELSDVFSIHVSGASTVQTHVIPARLCQLFSYGCPGVGAPEQRHRWRDTKVAVGIEPHRLTFGL